MGILETKLNSVFNIEGKKIRARGQDFEHGLQIVEIVNNAERNEDKIVLLDSFMPRIPFEFGGTQHIVKEYYAGSQEPTVQVLGPRESDMTINGKLNTKVFKKRVLDNGSALELSQAAVEYQELIDAMRIRGNLVKITLGEWIRFGFIEKTAFKMNRLAEIEYEISFSIVGFNPPKNVFLTTRENRDLIKPNKDVTNAAASALAFAQTQGIDAPQSIFSVINEKISGVADVVNVATSFIDGIVSDVNAIEASANRALGLIKYTRAYVSKTKREIGAIGLTPLNLGSKFTTEAGKTAATIKNVDYILKVQKNNTSLLAFLASLQKQFAEIAKTVPLMRHLVKEGDTLQKLSIKYYNTADNWKNIYDHNKLTTTLLNVGKVLEIPKI